MKKLLIFFTLITPQFIFSQQDTTNQTEDAVFGGYSETMPEYPGGQAEMIRFIIKNIEYPTIAQENNISGKVYVRFVVEKNGNISDIKVVRGVSPELDQEAIRVIKMMPKWKAGTQRGKPVRVTFTLPINFTLK